MTLLIQLETESSRPNFGESPRFGTVDQSTSAFSEMFVGQLVKEVKYEEVAAPMRAANLIANDSLPAVGARTDTHEFTLEGGSLPDENEPDNQIVSPPTETGSDEPREETHLTSDMFPGQEGQVQQSSPVETSKPRPINGANHPATDEQPPSRVETQTEQISTGQIERETVSAPGGSESTVLLSDGQFSDSRAEVFSPAGNSILNEPFGLDRHDFDTEIRILGPNATESSTGTNPSDETDSRTVPDSEEASSPAFPSRAGTEVGHGGGSVQGKQLEHRVSHPLEMPEGGPREFASKVSGEEPIPPKHSGTPTDGGIATSTISVNPSDPLNEDVGVGIDVGVGVGVGVGVENSHKTASWHIQSEFSAANQTKAGLDRGRSAEPPSTARSSPVAVHERHGTPAPGDAPQGVRAPAVLTADPEPHVRRDAGLKRYANAGNEGPHPEASRVGYRHTPTETRDLGNDDGAARPSNSTAVLSNTGLDDSRPGNAPRPEFFVGSATEKLTPSRELSAIAEPRKTKHGTVDLDSATFDIARSSVADPLSKPIPPGATSNDVVPNISSAARDRVPDILQVAEETSLLSLRGAEPGVSGDKSTPPHIPPSTWPRPVAAPDIARVMVQALAENGPRTIEVQLSPVELGKIRLSLTPMEAGLSVVIFAERGETIDLLRSQLSAFQEDLEHAGFGDVAFAFSEREDQEARPEFETGADVSIAAAPEAISPVQLLSLSDLSTIDRLDIRL